MDWALVGIVLKLCIIEKNIICLRCRKRIKKGEELISHKKSPMDKPISNPIHDKCASETERRIASIVLYKV